MHALVHINRLLNAIAAQNGISSLQLGANGTVALILRDGTELAIEYVRRTEQLFVYTEVATLDDLEVDRGVICERMLEMNCLGRDTVHGCLSLDGDHTVLYQVVLDVSGLTANMLDQALQRLLMQRQAIIDRIKRLDRNTPPSPPAVSVSSPRTSPFARFYQKRN